MTLWQIKYILFSSQRQKKISHTFYLLKVWLVVSGNVLFKKIDSISFFLIFFSCQTTLLCITFYVEVRGRGDRNKIISYINSTSIISTSRTKKKKIKTNLWFECTKTLILHMYVWKLQISGEQKLKKLNKKTKNKQSILLFFKKRKYFWPSSHKQKQNIGNFFWISEWNIILISS